MNAVDMNGCHAERAKPQKFVQGARVHIGTDRARERLMPTAKASSRLDFCVFLCIISGAGRGIRTPTGGCPAVPKAAAYSYSAIPARGSNDLDLAGLTLLPDLSTAPRFSSASTGLLN